MYKIAQAGYQFLDEYAAGQIEWTEESSALAFALAYFKRGPRKVFSYESPLYHDDMLITPLVFEVLVSRRFIVELNEKEEAVERAERIVRTHARAQELRRRGLDG